MKDYINIFHRGTYERRLLPGAVNTEYIVIPFDGSTVADLFMWAGGLLKKEKELNKFLTIHHNEDTGIYTDYEVCTSVTEEQKKEATEWLAANPADPNEVIRWRTPIPFKL